MNISFLVPPNYDFLIASLIEGLLDLGHNVVTSENSNYGFYLKRKEFINFSVKADLLVISSGSYCDYSILKQIKNDKVVFVDGSDFPSLDNHIDYPINLVFKRELLSQMNDLIQPLPFAAEKRYFNDFNIKRNIVSFISTQNNYYRRSIYSFIKNTRGDFSNIFIGGTGERSYNGISGVPSATPKYYTLLNSSIASINFPGKGWDCARYWEIIANKSCLISPKIEIIIPSPFIEGIHYLSFSTLIELNEKIQFCLDNPDSAREIAGRAYDHLLKYHTTKERAKYFLEVVDSKLVVGEFIKLNNLAKIHSRLFYLGKRLAYYFWKKIVEKYFFDKFKRVTNE
jgi:hypothetical protein